MRSFICCLELYLGRLSRPFVRSKGLPYVQAQEIFSRQVGWKIANAFVVFRDAFDVAFARDGNAVFGAFELSLKVAKILIRLKLRVALYDQHEAG